jgi:SAM-dependent methyltransferase
MNAEAHRNRVYGTKAPDALSWYRPHLEMSLALIERASGGSSASVIDVGAGESTLVDDLVARGYRDITVLDISKIALAATKKRLGRAAEHVHWMQGDVTQISLPRHSIHVWHDRAVFHFLTAPEHRAAYVKSVLPAVRPGGYVIVGAFGPDGPKKCSGLDVMRYDAQTLHSEFGAGFYLAEKSDELHHTPWGTAQQFVYCYCRVV